MENIACTLVESIAHISEYNWNNADIKEMCKWALTDEDTLLPTSLKALDYIGFSTEDVHLFNEWLIGQCQETVDPFGFDLVLHFEKKYNIRIEWPKVMTGAFIITYPIKNENTMKASAISTNFVDGRMIYLHDYDK